MYTTIALWQVDEGRFILEIRLVVHTSTITDRLYYAWPVLWCPDEVGLRSNRVGFVYAHVYTHVLYDVSYTGLQT